MRDFLRIKFFNTLKLQKNWKVCAIRASQSMLLTPLSLHTSMKSQMGTRKGSGAWTGWELRRKECVGNKLLMQWRLKNSEASDE